MTSEEKPQLLHFLTRPGMYLFKRDENNYISFIHGFELGKAPEDRLTTLVGTYLLRKYGIKQDALGWPNQLTKLAAKRKTNWIIAFRSVAIEVLFVNTAENAECNKLVTDYLRSLIHKISPDGHPWFDATWIEEWTVLCQSKHTWFTDLWTVPMLKVIKQINSEVTAGRIYSKGKLPTARLVELRSQFDKLDVKC